MPQGSSTLTVMIASQDWALAVALTDGDAEQKSLLPVAFIAALIASARVGKQDAMLPATTLGGVLSTMVV